MYDFTLSSHFLITSRHQLFCPPTRSVPFRFPLRFITYSKYYHACCMPSQFSMVKSISYEILSRVLFFFFFFCPLERFGRKQEQISTKLRRADIVSFQCCDVGMMRHYMMCVQMLFRIMKPPAINMFKLLCTVMDTFVNVWESHRVVCVYYAAGLSHSREICLPANACTHRTSVVACSLTTPPLLQPLLTPKPATAFNNYLNNNCSINIVTPVRLCKRQ